MTIPPGLSRSQFGAALSELTGVVGKDWVFSSYEDVALYRDAYSPLKDQPGELVASAAVAPENVEQVQEIVRIANRYSLPLYTLSTGRNLAYGGAAPAMSGCVVLDLKRMNRIIEVNDSSHFAIVEPGVSYFDLYNHIEERGLNVWIDCPDPGWGSPIGNALEHGVGHTGSRFRNHFGSHCGMEVVLANGEIVRTGMGALPGAKSWGEFNMGFGPITDGIFSQSNFGIVTKMGFWLMPRPDAMFQAAISAPLFDDLHTVIDLLKLFENSGLAPGMPQLISPLLGSGASTFDLVNMFLFGPPQQSDEHKRLVGEAKVGFSTALQKFGLDNNVPYWKLVLTFYGPPKVMAAQWEAAKEIAGRKIKDVRFEDGELVTDFSIAARSGKIYGPDAGVPNLEFFAMGTRAGGNPYPAYGHMGFGPVIPQTGEAVLEFNRVIDEAVRRIPVLREIPILNLKPFTLPASFYERTFLMLLNFQLVEDPAKNLKAIDAFRELIRIAADHGWSEYRTPPLFYDEVMATYSFNNHSLLRMHESIKDALDPKGILSPGRYGIWPRHFREKARR